MRTKGDSTLERPRAHNLCGDGRPPCDSTRATGLLTRLGCGVQAQKRFENGLVCFVRNPRCLLFFLHQEYREFYRLGAEVIYRTLQKTVSHASLRYSECCALTGQTVDGMPSCVGLSRCAWLACRAWWDALVVTPSCPEAGTVSLGSFLYPMIFCNWYMTLFLSSAPLSE